MDISKNKEIGRRIKAIREDMEISQTRLGNLIGVSYQQIQKYENGTSTLSVEKLDKIATALTTPISYFFGDYAKKNYKVGKIREEGKKYITNALEFEKLNADEKFLLKGYRSIKDKKARKGLILLLKGLLNTS